MAMNDYHDVDQKQVQKYVQKMHEREREYRNLKGWFWSCDANCQRAYDRYQIAQSELADAERKRDALLKEARQEVGIWSTIGVADVRKSFWSAWQSGKDQAARMTMYDVVFAAMRTSSQEESLMSFIMQMVFQYVVNLTFGLIFAVGYFVYAAYTLVVAYGESTVSGLAFFLLVVVASLSVLGTYLLAVYGTVAGGGVFILKQAAKAQLEGGAAGGGEVRSEWGTSSTAVGASEVDPTRTEDDQTSSEFPASLVHRKKLSKLLSLDV
eukprot:CAMPEP_0178389186 /NCGR_PEP_ID=MMETSP0689_2-20121128/9982_1 /TAXON_ID=160604 /ORGANISM="Amphidinium massartii, Strain CS-259" /LENGTH=266 /DNA_ID=CAMNT_0020009619 /DNA_START=203 /DNA_END=1000 /DNA_ORIENTATION=-